MEMRGNWHRWGCGGRASPPLAGQWTRWCTSQWQYHRDRAGKASASSCWHRLLLPPPQSGYTWSPLALWDFPWVNRLAREVLHHNNVLDTGNLVTILVQDRTELTEGLIGADDCWNLGLRDGVDDTIVPKVCVQCHNGHRVLKTASLELMQVTPPDKTFEQIRI